MQTQFDEDLALDGLEPGRIGAAALGFADGSGRRLTRRALPARTQLRLVDAAGMADSVEHGIHADGCAQNGSRVGAGRRRRTPAADDEEGQPRERKVTRPTSCRTAASGERHR